MKPSVRSRPSRLLRLRLGTRGSALALAQADWVAERLPGEVSVVTIATSGDRGAHADKSRFVKEIEEALLAEDIDLAVHSAKDVPGVLPDGLAIVGVPARANPLDALCGAPALDELPEGAVVGTASIRRRAQLAALRPDLEVRDLRGNVDTRLRRLEDGDFDAIVLARAGLERLGRAGAGVALAELVPAPGQGCLALQARAGDASVAEAAASLTDREALTALTAERALVTELGATCDTPIGALAEHAPDADGGALRLTAFLGHPDGSHWIRDELAGDPGDPGALGRAAAKRLLSVGASALLDVR
jgi:hydroxymethylbilane synthase